MPEIHAVAQMEQQVGEQGIRANNQHTPRRGLGYPQARGKFQDQGLGEVEMMIDPIRDLKKVQDIIGEAPDLVTDSRRLRHWCSSDHRSIPPAISVADDDRRVSTILT